MGIQILPMISSSNLAQDTALSLPECGVQIPPRSPCWAEASGSSIQAIEPTPLAYPCPTAFSLVPSSNGSGHRPFKPVMWGSNPPGTTTVVRRTIGSRQALRAISSGEVDVGFESQPNNRFYFGPSSSMGHIDKSSPGEFFALAWQGFVGSRVVEANIVVLGIAVGFS